MRLYNKYLTNLIYHDYSIKHSDYKRKLKRHISSILRLKNKKRVQIDLINQFALYQIKKVKSTQNFSKEEHFLCKTTLFLI